MGTQRPRSSLRYLRGLFAAGTAVGLTDRELLDRYVSRRAASDEAATEAEMAFAVLVDRHGGMVWGVCRRVLGDSHEAEDAFQATFLILVRKAASVRVDDSLGRWLYGVAHRVALRARAEAGRRGSPIDRDPPGSSEDPAALAERSDLRDILGEELDRLPSKYRCAIELCDLQGMTYDQAARQLGWPLATVKSRLTRGRHRLRERLSRRGLNPAPVEVAMSGLFVRGAAPARLTASAARAAVTGAGIGLSATVTQLTQGVLKMMMWENVRRIAAVALLGVGVTARALSGQGTDGKVRADQSPQAAPKPAETPSKKKGGDRRWIRRLPCGAIVEVVGISSFPSGPETWWRPDGTPLPKAPCDTIVPNVSTDIGVHKAVVVRLARIPEGAEHHWSIKEAWASSSGSAKRGGRPEPGLHEMFVVVPRDATTGTLVFKVATGSWKTLVNWGKNAGSKGGIVFSCIFSNPIALGDRTTIIVTHDELEKSVRLVALDADGQEIVGNIRSGTAVHHFKQIMVEFDCPLDKIQGFRLQSRGYEEVELPGIALKRR